MQRRAFLGSVTAGAVAGLGGCAGVLGGGCEPGEDELGDLAVERSAYDVAFGRFSSESVSVRGRVVYETTLGVVLDDGTGLADVVARRSDEVIDHDAVDVGDCLAGSGPVNVVQSEANETPYVAVRELRETGSDDDVEPLPDYPIPHLDPDWDRDAGQSVFTITGGDPVVADRLVVRWRREGDETPWPRAERARWHELTDVAPDEVIPEGSAFALDGDRWSVTLLWEHADGEWSREVQSAGVGKTY